METDPITYFEIGSRRHLVGESGEDAVLSPPGSVDMRRSSRRRRDPVRRGHVATRSRADSLSRFHRQSMKASLPN